jgi:lysophospholipase L1-like esterase
MPHCGGANPCNCVVTGEGVSGSGTLSDPYVITSVPEGGGGEPSAAALLDLPTADALLRMAQLRAGQDLLITAVGDSETAGTSLSGGGYDTSWPARLATLLGPVVGRWYEYGQQTATDSLKWTLTNTSGTSGPGAEGILLIRPGDYVTITTPVATTLKVRYANSGFVGALAGNLQVTIDGTVVTTITPDGSSSQATWTSGTLSNATHTMVLRNTHATAVAWCVAVYAGTAGTGITLNNAGLSGSSTDTWQATHHLSVWAHAARETSAVGIAFLSLGVNDAGLGVPVATYKTRLTTLAQRMRGIWAATIIVIQPQPSGVPWATWLTYTEAAREVADEQGCGIVDITQRWGPHDGTWGSTRLYSDVTHPSALGYRDIAAAIYHHLDAIPSGAAMVAGSGIQITVNDAADTITIRARKSIRDFLKPVQIDSDAATLAQVDDPASFIVSPGSVVWDNYAAIGYPAGNPVPVTPGTPHNPGARLQPTGGDNVQSLPFSFYANGKIGIHVTLWADTDIWVSIDGKPISADPFIIKVADTATFQPFVTIDTGNPDAPFVRYDITLGWGANLIQIINEPGALMTAGEAPTFRLGLTGDSYADSGIGPYYGGPAQTLRQFTGVNVIPLGQGSTGYTNDGSSSGDLTKEVFGGTNRLAAIAGAELDALIVVGSVNDGGSTPVATKAAALAFYAAVSPLPVIVVGVEPLYDAADPTYAGWDALNDALIEAADEAPNVIGFVDWRGEDWLTGTGSQSNIQYDGNQDWAIGDVAGTDTIHPSHAGWKLLLIPRLIEAIAPMEI